MSRGATPVLTGVHPWARTGTGLSTGPVTGLGVLPEKNMGLEAGKGSGTRDWVCSPEGMWDQRLGRDLGPETEVPPMWTGRQTLVKTLPSLVLRTRAVKMYACRSLRKW